MLRQRHQAEWRLVGEYAGRKAGNDRHLYQLRCYGGPSRGFTRCGSTSPLSASGKPNVSGEPRIESADSRTRAQYADQSPTPPDRSPRHRPEPGEGTQKVWHSFDPRARGSSARGCCQGIDRSFNFKYPAHYRGSPQVAGCGRRVTACERMEIIRDAASLSIALIRWTSSNHYLKDIVQGPFPTR